MKLMKVRRGILFVSFLLLPVTLFYFSPYLPVVGAISGVIAGSILVFGILFVLGMFIGRAPCGWLLGCGGLQEACFHVQDKKITAGRKDLIKFAIWIPWLAVIIAFFVLNRDRLQFNLLFHIEGGISVARPVFFVIYYLVIAVFVVLSLLLGKRASCHYICWMAPFMILGRKLGNLMRLPQLRLVISKKDCIHCGQCGKACPMGIDVQKGVELENTEHAECILCGECTKKCPKQILKLGIARPQNDKLMRENVTFRS
jgi:Polyferredoxin